MSQRPLTWNIMAMIQRDRLHWKNMALEVSDIVSPLDEDEFAQFAQFVNPQTESESYGIDIFIRVLEVIRTIRQRNI